MLHRLSVSPCTHSKQCTFVDVGFHFNFCFLLEGCGLVSGSLLFFGGRGELGESFVFKLSFFFWGGGGGGGGGILRGHFKSFFKIFFLFCGGTLLIFVQPSFIHSHNFFMYLGEV